MSRYDKPSHRIYMRFTFRQGWRVTFLEADLKRTLPRSLTFADPDKIRQLARRGEAIGTSEGKLMLDDAIAHGGGGVFLNLTPEQYKKLTVNPVATMPAKVPPQRSTGKTQYRRPKQYGGGGYDISDYI